MNASSIVLQLLLRCCLLLGALMVVSTLCWADDDTTLREQLHNKQYATQAAEACERLIDIGVLDDAR